MSNEAKCPVPLSQEETRKKVGQQRHLPEPKQHFPISNTKLLFVAPLCVAARCTKCKGRPVPEISGPWILALPLHQKTPGPREAPQSLAHFDDHHGYVQWIGLLGKILTGNHGFYHNCLGFPVEIFPSSNSMDFCCSFSMFHCHCQ